MEKTQSFLRSLMLLCAAPLIWFGHFSLVYGWTALLCERAGPSALIAWGIAVATLIAAAAIAAFGLWAFGRMRNAEDRRFAHGVAAALGVVSLVGVVWTGLPAAFVAACS
ncbi:MAG TPA: hypothetical protein VIK87_12020 [Sphingomonadales bacterium]